MTINKGLVKTISEIEQIIIPEERKKTLTPLVEYLKDKIQKEEHINLNFICTHNSRRSHLGQIWMQTLAHYFNIGNISTYSGGTEATAMAEPIVETLKAQGFDILKLSEDKNPIYGIKYNNYSQPIICFSKEYFNNFNPNEKFGAILTCSSADEGCPFVTGTDKRMAITYEDPKLFDGTPQQKEKYTERSLQIASELYYVFTQLKK